MPDLKPGDIIAERFRVEALLGEGGIARVYKVRHVRLGSVHALKMLMLDRPSLADRLLLEGRIQAQLRHPNLVRVTDVVEHLGNPCLVMEHVDGTHLQALLARRGPLALDPALGLFAGVLSAVAEAHDHGVLHRDLKPANILLERTTAGLIPKVSDFGIAKVATEGLRDGTTRVGVQMGTPGYMAPEQVEDAKTIDHRADIFALGAILYEMLTGDRPFSADTAFHTMQATLHGRFEPLAARLPDCPSAVDHAVRVALSVDMQHRFPDCHAFADALFLRRPSLRGHIVRSTSASSAGLHRPDAASATPTPQNPPTLVADEGEPPGPATPAPVHSPIDVGGISVSGPDTAAAVSELAAAMSPAASDPGAGSAGRVSIGGDSASPPTPAPVERPQAGGRGPLLLLAAGAFAVVGGGLWWQSRGDGEPLAVEQVQQAPDALGEAVTDGDAAGPSALTSTAADAAPSATDTPAEKARTSDHNAELRKSEQHKAEQRKAEQRKAEQRKAEQRKAEEPPAAEPEAAPAPAPASTADPKPASAPVPDADADAEVAAAEVAAAEVAAAEDAAAEDAAAEDAAVEDAAPEDAAAEDAAAEDAAAEDAAAEDAAAEDAAAEDAAAEDAAPEDAAAEAGEDAVPEDAAADAQTDTETTTEAPPPTPAAPTLVGTWAGTADGNPLRLVLLSQDGDRLVGELTITQGGQQRAIRVTGTVDASSHRVGLYEEGGGGLAFSGVVRGTGMMGTYGRKGGGGNQSWSATRQ